MSHRGFPLTPARVKEAVKLYLDRTNTHIKTFTDNRPGKTWWYRFLRNHSEIKMGRPEKLESTRAMACTEESLTAWFNEFQALLTKVGIKSGDQIFDCDESGFPLQPKNTQRVCIDRHARRNFQNVSSNKVSISTLQCISATGFVLPATLLFPGKKTNPEYSLGLPKSWYIGFSDNGWMDTHQFYGWITNHFIPKIPATRPVILLLDGHSSHIDYWVSKKCEENDIFFDSHRTPLISFNRPTSSISQNLRRSLLRVPLSLLSKTLESMLPNVLLEEFSPKLSPKVVMHQSSCRVLRKLACGQSIWM